MQFGGVRTDDDFKVVDEWQSLITLSDDILPEPDAVMLTGITPQKTIEEGISEPEFISEFKSRALKRGTTIVGFNNIRFDDEFMRFCLWRNFHDPYEWHWKDGRSRWDLLDVMRMTRALRPDGIEWPFEKGKATNRLELLAKANNISHDAHDALADVQATLELAKKVKKTQPKLFDYLLSVRTKEAVLKLISPNKSKPFVYTSGRYPSENEKTTIAVVISAHPSKPNSYLVYDLRHDPADYADWSTDKITKHTFIPWKQRYESEEPIEEFPVKSIQINRTPAIAPIGVLDKGAEARINLDVTTALSHLKKLSKAKGLAAKVFEVWKKERDHFDTIADADMNLYDGFIEGRDKMQRDQISSLEPAELADLSKPFSDKRLNELLSRYKARNYPAALSQEEKERWEKYKTKRLSEGVGGSMTFKRYFSRLQQLSQKADLSSEDMFIIEELKLYGESIAPELED